MTICSKCGAQLPEGAKFCGVCGSTAISKTDENIKKQKILEEELNKCACCGAIVDAFTLICPYCGNEIKRVNGENAVKMLAEKLSKVDLERNIKPAEALAKKRNILLNYQVPGYKDELSEFIFLALSNIDVHDGDIDELEQVWITKLEQAYQRAKVLFGDTQDFLVIKSSYDEKMQQVTSFHQTNIASKKKMKFIAILLLIVSIIGVRVSQSADSLMGTICSILFVISIVMLVISTKKNKKK